MKCSTPTQPLLDALARLKLVIPSRTTLPILGNVLIDATGDKLRVTANNLDQHLSIELSATIEKPGSFTLPCVLLHSVVSHGSDASCSFALAKSVMEFACGQKKAKLLGLPAEEFPETLPSKSEDATTIPGEKLHRWLTCCIAAASTDTTRYVLNGVHFASREGKLILEATDGHRLVIASTGIETTIAPSILPNEGARVLRGLIGDAEVLISEADGAIFASSGGWRFGSKVVDGNFPPTERHVSSENILRVESVRADLIDAVRYASLFNKPGYPAVKLESSPGSLRVSAQSDDRSGDVVVAGFPRNPNIKIAADASYLIDQLNCFDSEDVAILLRDEISPFFIRDESLVSLVMPLRIS